MSDLWRAGFADNASIQQLAALQAELARLMDEVDPQGGLKDTATLAVGMLHRYGTGIVHVDSGRLKNSLVWDVQASSSRASAIWGTNLSYSVFENRRGGDHAFVDRTEREEGPNAARLFGARIAGGNR